METSRRVVANVWVWWTLSAVSLSFVWVHPYVTFLVIPGVYFFLVALTKTKTYESCFWGGWLVGTGKALGAILWFWYVYPLSWLGLSSGVLQMVMIGVFWFSVSAVMGLSVGVLALVFKRVLHDSYTVWSFPILWVMTEVLGSLLFSVFSIGAGSLPNIQFTFGYVGYVLADWSLFSGVAAVGGVYLLSFFVASVGLLIWVLLRRDVHTQRTHLCVAFSALLLLLVSSWYLLSTRSQTQITQSVIAVNTFFTADNLEATGGSAQKSIAVHEAVQTALALRPDIILLPEDSRFTHRFPSPTAALAYVTENAPAEVLLVDSARVVDAQGVAYLRAFVYDTKRQQVYETDKQYLVPQGEFMPYLSDVLFGMLAGEDLVDAVRSDISYRPGPLDSYDTFPNDIPGVLFCMESVTPFGVASLRSQQDMPFVLHVVSHGWFREPTILWTQLKRMLKVQALWSDTTIIQAGNMSHSFLTTNTGVTLEGKKVARDRYWELIQY